MPPSADVIVPPPLPDRSTDSDCGPSNRAVTARSAVTSRLHRPVPEHAPVQPRNVELVAELAVSVTADEPTSAVQVGPQSIAGGLDVTVPVPPPVVVTATSATPVPPSDTAVWPPGSAPIVTDVVWSPT